MKSKICCFAGHNECYDDSVKKLIEKAAEMIIEEDIKEFWVGNYGGFDRVSASVIYNLKNIHPDVKLNLVIPYSTKRIDESKEKYDNIIIADMPESTPMKYRIIKANEYMVNNSDFLICYVKYPWGGAAKTLEYARRKNVKILNLYKEES